MILDSVLLSFPTAGLSVHQQGAHLFLLEPHSFWQDHSTASDTGSIITSDDPIL